MASRMFRHRVRVPYAHVDKLNVVYYANYFIYFEMARGELLRESGIPCGELEEKGIFLPVVECGCVYRRPAGYDELIEVRSVCSCIRKTRLRIDCEVYRGEELLVKGYTVHVNMNSGGKAVRLPQELVELCVDGRGRPRPYGGINGGG